MKNCKGIIIRKSFINSIDVLVEVQNNWTSERKFYEFEQYCKFVINHNKDMFDSGICYATILTTIKDKEFSKIISF